MRSAGGFLSTRRKPAILAGTIVSGNAAMARTACRSGRPALDQPASFGQLEVCERAVTAEKYELAAQEYEQILKAGTPRVSGMMLGLGLGTRGYLLAGIERPGERLTTS